MSTRLNFFQLLVERAKQHPDKVALRLSSSGQSVTFSELLEEVDVLSQTLHDGGVSRLDRVGVQLPNRKEFLVALLALSQLGAVPICLDTSYKVMEVSEILEDSGAAGLLTLASHAPSLDAWEFSSVAGCESLSFACLQGRQAPSVLEDVALLKYTSGSTGVPKGVMLSAEDMWAEGDNVVQTLGVQSSDVILATVPLFHSYGFDFCVMPMLLTGATMVLVERFLPRPVLRLLESEKVTIFPAVPFMFDVMARIQLDQPPGLQHVRYCISAAAPLSARTVRRFFKKFNLVICQNYGSSEAGAITLEIRRKPGVPSTCLGQPLKNVVLQIRDDNGDLQRANEMGEVVVGGPQVSSYGYYEDPKLSGQTFQDGFCFTGDLGYLDEHGNLFLSGRKKNLINVGGKKVIPQEVEEALGEHPSIRDVAVVGVADEVLGEVVKACIVAEHELSVEELVLLCQEKLASYKVPQRWSFWKELPRTQVGKLDVARLKG